MHHLGPWKSTAFVPQPLNRQTKKTHRHQSGTNLEQFARVTYFRTKCGYIQEKTESSAIGEED